MHSMKTQYRRNLPHVLPPGATIFFTFRLANSIAQATLHQLIDERELAIQDALANLPPSSQPAAVANLKKQHFAKYDAVLDAATSGPTWLREPAVAEVIMLEIKRLPELDVAVLAFCLMANHVHLVVQLPENPAFSAARMTQRLKGRTALAANRLLGLTGQEFWRKESYDHVVRNSREEERVIAYVVNNPVKAGLVSEWTQWPYTHVAVR